MNPPNQPNPPTNEELYTLRALSEMAQDPNSDAHQVLHHLRTNVVAVTQMQQQIGSLQAQLQAQTQSGPSNGPITSLSAALEALVANNLEQQQLYQAHQASVSQILERLSQRQAGSQRAPIPLPLPTKFKGNEDEYSFAEFKSKLRTTFLRFSESFPTDEHKINYALQCLEGNPAIFFAPYVNGDTPDDDGYLSSYSSFLYALEEIYGDQNQIDEINHKLARLRQTGSMVEYTTKFRTLSARTQWNDHALLARFKDGLSEDIKNVLTPQWHSLRVLRDTMSAAATAYQNLQFQTRFRSRQTHPRPQHQSTSSRRPIVTPAVASQSSSSAMDLDAMRFKKLTPVEKQRRRDNGLCLYCGGDDHFAGACPKKTAQLAAVSFDSENELA
jgi:predicted transcriptional regulator